MMSRPPSFLSGLTANERKLILESAERKEYRANQVIITTGASAARLFLMTEGRVKYYRVTAKGDEVLLWWLAADDIFGLGTLLHGPTFYIGTAQAIDDCELMVWNRNK